MRRTLSFAIGLCIISLFPVRKFREDDFWRVGIGRTPVREAIIRIERMVWLMWFRKAGRIFPKLTWKRQRCTFCTAERWSWNHAGSYSKDDGSGVSGAEGKLAWTGGCDSEGGSDTFFDLDEAFHRFYTIADRDNIWDWLQTVNMQLNRFRWIRLKVNGLNWQRFYSSTKLLDVVYRRDLEDVRFQDSPFTVDATGAQVLAG